MSYAGIFWLPVEIAAGLLGLLFLLVRRPLGAAIVGAIVSLGLGTELQWGASFEWSRHGGPADGVLGEHLLASGVHERADWAAGLLAWTLPPLLLCLVGAVLSARLRRHPGPLLLVLPAALPTGVLLAWTAARGTAWAPDDPRWTLRYVDEWRAAGRPVDNGGPCIDFLATEARVAGVAPAEDVAAARSDCLALCDGQAATGSYNPMSLEGVCASAR